MRRTRIAIAALAAAGCVSALPAGATAAEAPICGGNLEINNEIPGIEPPGGLSYKFNCNAQVIGYAVVSNRQVDYFGTEVLVLDANSGEATPEQFSCEGPFPGSGFGCRRAGQFRQHGQRRVRDRPGPLRSNDKTKRTSSKSGFVARSSSTTRSPTNRSPR